MPTGDAAQLSGYVEDLRVRLRRFKRSEIERIGALGGIHWSQLYAFRTPTPTKRIGTNVRLDSLLRIEQGLLAFEEEKADQATSLGTAVRGTAEHETPDSQANGSRALRKRVAGSRAVGAQ